MEQVGDQDITVLFVQRAPLSWRHSTYGYLNAVDYGTMGLALFFLLSLLSTSLTMTDTAIVILGIVFKIIMASWAGFCTPTWMVFVSDVSGAIGGLINPALRSILSQLVEPGEVIFFVKHCSKTLQ